MRHGGDVYNNKIKYDFSVNLNPNEYPDEIIRAVKQSMNMIGQYPDLQCSTLRSRISVYEGISEDLIVCGNGASELLHAAIKVIAPKRVILLAPGFTGYLHAAGNVEIIYYHLKEENDFRLDYEFISYLEINSCGEGDVLVLADPNNPTGLRIDRKLLARICTVCHTMGIKIILDRCFYHLTDIYTFNTEVKKDVSSLHIGHNADVSSLYIDHNAGVSSLYIDHNADVRSLYIDHNADDLYDNIIFINAYTKTFSVPGIRIGYAISSDKRVIDDIRSFLPEWNVSVIASEVGTAAAELMAASNYMQDSVRLIDNEKKYMIKELNKLDIKVYPSDANYLLLFSKYSLYDKLLDMGILIRDCSDYVGLRAGYYRIAIRKHEDNIILIDALQTIINN